MNGNSFLVIFTHRLVSSNLTRCRFKQVEIWIWYEVEIFCHLYDDDDDDNLLRTINQSNQEVIKYNSIPFKKFFLFHIISQTFFFRFYNDIRYRERRRSDSWKSYDYLLLYSPTRPSTQCLCLYPLIALTLSMDCYFISFLCVIERDFSIFFYIPLE